jgi:hypothetical protein
MGTKKMGTKLELSIVERDKEMLPPLFAGKD